MEPSSKTIGLNHDKTQFNDRQRGTLIGLAIGDALGAAVEFRSPGTFPEVTGYRGGGPHGLGPRRMDRRYQHGPGLGRQHRQRRLGSQRPGPPLHRLVAERANIRSTAAASTSASRPAAP